MAARDLSGKICVVTGAGSGLGKAMSLGLSAAGAKVAGVDVNLEALNATAKEATGAGVVPIQTDITKVNDANNAISKTISGLGGMHVLINCAGLGMPTLRVDYWDNRLYFWQADPDKWQRLMDVNVRGAFLMGRAAAPHLIEQKWGRIVNVTTSMNTMIRGGNMPYGQSKASLEAASAAWADDFVDTGVTCNVLVPGGPANTAMVPAASSPDRDAMVQPDVMKAPVCWLMSDDSEGFNGNRLTGTGWDPTLPGRQAAEAAAAPAAWPGAGQQSVWPDLAPT